MTSNIEKILNDLANAVENDTFNLTRNDHDEILVSISQLKQKIENIYQKNKPDVSGE